MPVKRMILIISVLCCISLYYFDVKLNSFDKFLTNNITITRNYRISAKCPFTSRPSSSIMVNQ